MNWSVPEELQYTPEHEWIKSGPGEGTILVGITDYAQDKLGDVVFVELPAVGQVVTAGQSLAVVESVKAVVDIYAPASGEITRVNEELLDQPELLNEDPYGKGWVAALKIAGPRQVAALLSPREYSDLIADLEKEAP